MNMPMMHKSVIFLCAMLLCGKGLCGGKNVYARLRDPFNLPTHKKKVQKQEISLAGIVYSGSTRCAAILVHGEKRDIVAKGERFDGYMLTIIGKKFVVLVRGDTKKRLVIE